MEIHVPPQWCIDYEPLLIPRGALPLGAKWGAPTMQPNRRFSQRLVPVDLSEMPEITPAAVEQYVGPGALPQYYASLAEAASRGLIPQAAVGRFFPQLWEWYFSSCFQAGYSTGWHLRLNQPGTALSGLVSDNHNIENWARFIDTAITIIFAVVMSAVGEAVAAGLSAEGGGAAGAAGGGAETDDLLNVDDTLGDSLDAIEPGGPTVEELLDMIPSSPHPPQQPAPPPPPAAAPVSAGAAAQLGNAAPLALVAALALAAFS